MDKYTLFKIFMLILKFNSKTLFFQVRNVSYEIFLKRFRNNPSPILELGSGIGLFLQACKQNSIEAIGLEYEDEGVHLTKEKGLHAIKHDLSDTFPFSDESFSAVFSNQVIEHLPSSVQISMIKESYRVLVAGGQLLIISPCRHYEPARKDKCHINLLTPSELKQLVESHGFKDCIMGYNRPQKIEPVPDTVIKEIWNEYMPDLFSQDATVLAFKNWYLPLGHNMLTLPLNTPDRVFAAPLVHGGDALIQPFTSGGFHYRTTGESEYVTTRETTSFDNLPRTRHFRLKPGTPYTLTAQVIATGPRPTLYMIEYSEEKRTQTHQFALSTGRQTLHFTTQPDHANLVLALRLTGEGTMVLRDVRIAQSNSQVASESTCASPLSALGIDQATMPRGLTRDPFWIFTDVSLNSAVSINGQLSLTASDMTVPNATLARIVYVDASGATIEGPYKNISQSKLIGPFRYLETDQAGEFQIDLGLPPANAARVILGFQQWKAQGNVELRKIHVRSSSVTPQSPFLAETRLLTYGFTPHHNYIIPAPYTASPDTSLSLVKQAAPVEAHTQHHHEPAQGERTVQTGPKGRFRQASFFFDPSGYRRYVGKHHVYYDGRDTSFYSSTAEKFAGMDNVLDVGCGPGLLMQALLEKGVKNVLGLERDPVYLDTCRHHGLPVIAHDLNDPFPFLASATFDGIVIHHTLDYLAPVSIRTALREIARILKPSGLLVILSRSDGQQSGDPTRTIAFTDPLIRTFLSEAGLKVDQLKTGSSNVHVEAHLPSDATPWPPQLLEFAETRLTPWRQAGIVLAPDSHAWDNKSARDFTILTQEDKQEFRPNGKRVVAYYTGYHEQDGTIHRAVCRATSDDGILWRREPVGPVLEGGSWHWDATGVAAGTVIYRAGDHETPYVMFFSGRGQDGNWPGIGIAFSKDGVHWTKENERILRVEDYPGLKHLALADVIRTSSGVWLMHCEGWIQDWNGWAIFQAESEDGLRWTAKQTSPVLHPQNISWGARHAANPKVLEVQPGRFLLGFNAADESLAFQLGLAESSDCLSWTQFAGNPIICTEDDQYRVESCFLTRDAWLSEDKQIYFFAAHSRSTERSSSIARAVAAKDTSWPCPQWYSRKRGLYTIHGHRLVARTGANSINDTLRRDIPINGELQCTCMVDFQGGASGSVKVVLSNKNHQETITLTGREITVGQHGRNVSLLHELSQTDQKLSLCVKIIRPLSSHPELVVLAWCGRHQVVSWHVPIHFCPAHMSIQFAVPSGEPGAIANHVDVWEPKALQVEAVGDAQTYLGVSASNNPLLPDVPATDFPAIMDKAGVGRALVLPYGSQRDQDTYDQFSWLAKTYLGRIFPFIRLNFAQFQPDDVTFLINQLELLWQKGMMAGLKIHMAVTTEYPPPLVLAWIEKRQVLTIWHIAHDNHFQYLLDQVLTAFSFPVLLSHFGGYPLDWKRYQKAITLLDKHPQIYLITSIVWFQGILQSALSAHPHRILFGSDFPAVSPLAGQETIRQLPVPEEYKTLVLSENLRFLTERFQTIRWELLQDQTSLLFPPVPESSEDCDAQGFQIILPQDLPADENRQARDFWQGYEVKPWYKQHKPWATMLAGLIKDLNVGSVLEFGCNVGRNLRTIHELLPETNLVGIDINPDAVQIGREQTGLDLRVGDEQTLLNFQQGQFDFVFTLSVLDHIADIKQACHSLLHCASKYAFFLEVTLPVEGKVLQHFDHKLNKVRETTGASYSWHIDKYIAEHERVIRVDKRPVYLHDASLGPYYYVYFVCL